MSKIECFLSEVDGGHLSIFSFIISDLRPVGLDSNSVTFNNFSYPSSTMNTQKTQKMCRGSLGLVRNAPLNKQKKIVISAIFHKRQNIHQKRVYLGYIQNFSSVGPLLGSNLKKRLAQKLAKFRHLGLKIKGRSY